jgi:hypothetical protein
MTKDNSFAQKLKLFKESRRRKAFPLGGRSFQAGGDVQVDIDNRIQLFRCRERHNFKYSFIDENAEA